MMKDFKTENEERMARRKMIVRLTVDKVNQELLTRSPDLNHHPIDPMKFVEILKKLESFFYKKLSTTRERKIAVDHLIRRVNSHNEKTGDKLPSPAPLSRITKDAPLRTKAWSDDRKRLNEAHHHWLAGLDRTDTVELNEQETLGLFFYTAIIYGGLCDYRALIALPQALSNPYPIQHCENLGLMWIDLYYKDPRYSNCRINGKARIYRLWPLTEICKLSVERYLRTRAKATAPGPIKKKAILEAIKISFKSITGVELPFNSMKKLCKVGFCVLEREPGSKLTQQLCEYSVGRVRSFSLQPHARHVLFDHLNAKSSYPVRREAP